MARRLLLITGIPGTGKTTIGTFLSVECGFRHVNREVHEPRAFTDNPRAFLDEHPGDIVATWGFRPYEDLEGVQQLIDLGFKGVWLDGFRPFALAQVIQAPDKSETGFYQQLYNIEGSCVRAKLGFPQVNPFRWNGCFRDRRDIVEELLQVFRPTNA